MRSQVYGRLSFLLLLINLLSFGYIFTHGFYSFTGSLIIFICLVLFTVFILKFDFLKFKLKKKNFIRLLIINLFLNVNLTYILYGGLYQTIVQAVNLSHFFLRLSLLTTVFLFFKLPFKQKKIVGGLLFILWFILHILMVVSSPEPKIDVYDYLKKGALGLSQGKNPYSLTYKKLYLNVEPSFYSYLPFMIFYTLPFVLLFNDPRYAFIFAQGLIFYFLVYKFKWKDKQFGTFFSLLISLLICYHPLALYITEQSYTEPLILLEILIFYYFLINKNRLSGVMLGISLATKQYFAFVLSFVYKNKLFKKKYLFQAFLASAILTLPFFMINKADFINDVFLLQYLFPPRYEGLTFFSTLFYLFRLTYYLPLAVFIWVLAALFLYKITKNFDNNFIFKFGLFLLAFFYFNKWSFVNYYYLITNLLMLAVYSFVYELEKE